MLVPAVLAAVVAATVVAEAEAADWHYRGEELVHFAGSERGQTGVEAEVKMRVFQAPPALLVSPYLEGQNLAEEGREGGREHLGDLEGMVGRQAGTRAWGTREEVHCI